MLSDLDFDSYLVFTVVYRHPQIVCILARSMLVMPMSGGSWRDPWAIYSRLIALFVQAWHKKMRNCRISVIQTTGQGNYGHCGRSIYFMYIVTTGDAMLVLSY